jgi:hypothetical protein
MWSLSKSTHRKLITILALLAAISLTVVPAFAARPHFSSISLSVSTTSASTAQVALATPEHYSNPPANALIAKGKVVDLVNDVKVTLKATGIAQVSCESDHDWHRSSTHSATFTVYGEQTIKVSGNHATFTVVSSAPAVSAHDAGCSDEHHGYGGHEDEPTITSVSYQSVELTLKDAKSGAKLDQEKLQDCKTKGNKVKCHKQGHHDDDDD